MSDNQEALTHLKEAETTLAANSAAGYPESIVARTLHKMRQGIAVLEGKILGPKPVVTAADINSIPAVNNRGDKLGPEPVAVPKPIAAPAPVVWIGKYADGFTVEGDRATFPDKSPKGAKRVSVEKK